MDLDAIRQCVHSDDFTALKRDPETAAKYNQYRSDIVKEWVSIEDVVKVKYLGATVKETESGLKYASYPCDLNSDELRYSLHPNKYPYDVAKDVRHMVLWVNRPMLPPYQVNALLSMELGSSQFFWFEQDTNYKSVKGVWHVHVFVKS